MKAKTYNQQLSEAMTKHMTIGGVDIHKPIVITFDENVKSEIY